MKAFEKRDFSLEERFRRNDEFTKINGGLGIGVYKYDDIFQDGIRAVIRVDGKQITNSSVGVTFEVYNNTFCSGDAISESTTVAGATTFSDLPHSVYSLKVVSEKYLGGNFSEHYIRKIKNDCVVPYIDLYGPGQTVYIDYTTLNVSSCETELNALANPTKTQLIELFKKYEGNTNLLNFDNPSCSATACDTTNNISCLSGNLSKTNNFSENNLSCSDEIIKDEYGNPIAFCDYDIKLNNQLGTNMFYGISGQFLIKKLDETTYSINDNTFTNKNVVTDGNGILKLESSKVCYMLKDKTLDESQFSPKTNDDLNISFNNKALVGIKTNEIKNDQVIDDILKKSEKIYTYKYDLNDVVLDKFTGLTGGTSDNTEIIKGLITSFNDKSGTIDFGVKYDNTTYTPNSSDSCKSELSQKLVIFPETNPKGKLNLEFRIIDTNNPFVDRDTNANWCDGSDCDKDNGVVQSIVKNSNNSFNKTGEGPKYKITLTPSDILIIRKYNEDNKYDSYKLYCNTSGCRNAFIYSLINGKVMTYKKISSVKYIKDIEYGILSNKLIINDSL